jgi:hypothetical protein
MTPLASCSYRRSASLSANSAEVTTSNLRNGAAFDNLKASWGKAFSVGDFKSNLNCKYDYNSNKDFLKEASLSGNLLEGDLTVGYDVSKDFSSKATSVKLTAETSGTKFAAEYDTENNLKEVSAHREVEVGDRKVDLEPAWLVQAKTARVKLMSALGNDGKVRAQVDYSTGDKSASYEVGYEHSLKDGKQVSATLNPNAKELEVEYVDSKFEDGATWTATATVPMEDGNNVLDAAKLQLKRAWSW